jgi:hypothetical protein
MSRPDEITTEEEALELLRQIGDVLARGCPVEEELILALGYIPEKLLTTELCLNAVKKNGWALRYVLKKLMTAEVCLEAVKKNGFAIDYVPEKLREEVRGRLETGE